MFVPHSVQQRTEAMLCSTSRETFVRTVMFIGFRHDGHVYVCRLMLLDLAITVARG